MKSFFLLQNYVPHESKGESVLVADADTREQLIKDHLTNRINQLTLSLQLAESKAISFHAEVSIESFSKLNKVMWK